MDLTNKDFMDARGNALPTKVQQALISSASALLTGTPAATEAARKDWNSLKGADSMAFRDAFQKIKDKLANNGNILPMVRAGLGTYESAGKPQTKADKALDSIVGPGTAERMKQMPLKTAAEKVKAHVEGKAAEKKAGMSEETKAKLRAAKDAKVKDAKPKIEYTWNRKHEDVGVKVFTNHGVGVIRAFDPNNAAYLVYIEATETEKVVSKKGAHHKAFPEHYRDRYVVDKTVRTSSGAFSISRGDDVAKAINALTVEQLADVASRAGLADKFATWGERNAGMQRMNLGNCIRGLLKKEDTAVKATQAVVYATKLPRLYQAPEKKPYNKPTAEVKATNIRKKIAEAETGEPAKIAGKQVKAGTPKKK